MTSRVESPALWERLSRAVVLVSALAAVAVQHALWVSWRDLPVWLAVDALVLGAAWLARSRPDLALGLVLGGSFLLHGRLLAYGGLHAMAQVQPAMMALLALSLARGPRLRWHVPRAWRLPLVWWALVIALTWPIVLLRELHFAPGISLAGSLAVVNNGYGVRAIDAAGWVARTAVVQLAAIIWFDGLFRRGAAGPEQASRVAGRIIGPLAAGMAAAFLVACWQAYVDIELLNFEHWSSVGRATGTLLDGNALGISAALLGPLVFMLARRGAGPGEAPARAVLPFGATLLTVLLSGSTSALLVVLPGLAVLAWTLVDETRRASTPWPWKGLARLGATVALAGLLSVPSGASSVERLARFVPESDTVTPGTVVSAQLRDRPFFARLGLEMVATWPVSGIGIGSFHTLANDVAVARGMTDWVEFENALNWYVHQLAELGVLGSLGWIVWLGLLLPRLGRCLGQPGRRVPAVVLLGLGVASLFGVHAQNPEVLLLAWTLVFWLAPDSSPGPGSPVAGRWLGTAAIVLALFYAAVQATVSVTSLRVERRAALAGWTYEVGFHGWERSDRLGPYRWTRRRARALLDVEDRWLEMTLAAFRPGLEQRPLRVEILLDGRVVEEVTLRDTEPVALRLPVPEGERVELEIVPETVWCPADDGLPDERELGVAVARWRFRSRAAPPGPAGPDP